MTVWQCAECQTVNDANAQSCIVCTGTTRLIEAVPPKPAPAGRPASPVMSPGAGFAGVRTPVAYPPMPVTPPRRRSRTGVGVALAALLTVGCLGTFAVQHFHADDAASEPTATATVTTESPVTETTTSPATTSTTTEPPPPETDEPEPEVSRVGLVALKVPSPDAERVARMFDAYFSAVNARDYDAVLALYDPTGVLDTTDATKAQRFVDDISTTKDDQVVLEDVTDNGATIVAAVRFRSRQAAGKGPRAHPDQTCTKWSLRYTLADDSGGLLIKKGSGSSTSC